MKCYFRLESGPQLPSAPERRQQASTTQAEKTAWAPEPPLHDADNTAFRAMPPHTAAAPDRQKQKSPSESPRLLTKTGLPTLHPRIFGCIPSESLSQQAAPSLLAVRGQCLRRPRGSLSHQAPQREQATMKPGCRLKAHSTCLSSGSSTSRILRERPGQQSLLLALLTVLDRRIIHTHI